MDQQALIDKYVNDVKSHVKTLPANLQPSAAQLDKIIAKDSEYLKTLSLAPTMLSAPVDHAEFGLGDLIPGIPNPFDPKAACILTHIVVGAAILAAWVASGGTLAIGTVISGVTITQPIYAALVGGASGAIIASILCN